MELKESEFRKLKNEVTFLRERLKNLEPISPLVDSQDNEIARIRRGRESLLHSALDCIITIDSDGRIIEFNPAAERTFGYAREDVLGKPMAGLIIPPELRAAHSEGVRNYLHTGEGPVLNQRIEITAMRSNSEIFPVELAITPDRIAGQQIFTAYIRDLSEQKETEAALKQSDTQLRTAQKMEAIGRLAGGIAHDFNNVLTAILGYSELIQDCSDDPALVSESASQIQCVAERAIGLTAQLLMLNRQQPLELLPVDLNEHVGETNHMLHRMIPEELDFHSELSVSPLVVTSHPTLISQIVMNLVINARDAIEGNGRILIQTSERTLSESDSEWLSLTPGKYAALEVIDSGCGMSEEIQAKAFDPFFTTKDVSKGTGLGLSTVYGIVKQSNGGVKIESEPGQGTSICVFLPLSESTHDKIANENRPDDSLRGTETVLVVEDEQPVRKIITEVLKRKGYQIHSAQDGEEALAILSEMQEEQIDLLITDMIMPRLGGKELIPIFRKQRPSAKILMISGYSEESPQQLESAGSIMFLQKPFRTQHLLSAVRKLLNANKTP
ncbi:MAG: PAS domain S-box protein [Planctomycetota bacterium]|nr:PAS domain S-box protein [Planctomycetota bacterium]